MSDISKLLDLIEEQLRQIEALRDAAAAELDPATWRAS